MNTSEISTLELKSLLDESAELVLLDCRGVDYYLWEHLPGAKNLRWKYVPDKARQMFPDTSQKIVTYCDSFSCNASTTCFQKLHDLGYKNLYEFSGGLADWKAHGLPTVREPMHRLADNVYRFPRQKFYSEDVNSYLIVEPDFVLLLDGPQQLTEEHEDFIKHFRKPIKAFMTHGPTAGQTEVLQKKYGAEIYLYKGDKNNGWLTVKPDHWIDDGFKFTDHLQVIHTPGHSDGSAVLWDSKHKFLFTGDHLEGTKDGEIRDYFKLNDGHEGNVEARFKGAIPLVNLGTKSILPFHDQMILSDANIELQKFINKYKKEIL